MPCSCKLSLVDSDQPARVTATSGDLIWIPQPGQMELFPQGFAPVHKDIPIAVLGAGFELLADESS